MEATAAAAVTAPASKFKPHHWPRSPSLDQIPILTQQPLSKLMPTPSNRWFRGSLDPPNQPKIHPRRPATYHPSELDRRSKDSSCMRGGASSRTASWSTLWCMATCKIIQGFRLENLRSCPPVCWIFRSLCSAQLHHWRKTPLTSPQKRKP